MLVTDIKIGAISVLTAIVTTFGTYIGAYYSGIFDVEKTNATGRTSINLAKLQFNNELIKSVLSSNNPANSLLFYADIGLLEGLKADEIKKYAEEENKRINKGGQGPSLLPSFIGTPASNNHTWLDADKLKAISPNASQPIIVSLTTVGNYLLTGFEINKNRKRLSSFIGQIAHETNGFIAITENGNFSDVRLLQMYPGLFDNNTAKAYAHNPEKFFNRIYAGKFGNGPESSGDGYNFRGRGYINITGRDMYEKMSRETGVDLIKNPDIAADTHVALLIAAIYWNGANLNSLADDDKLDQITRAITGGISGLDSRRKYTALALNALQK